MNYVIATTARSAKYHNISNYIKSINDQKILPRIVYFVDDGKNPIGLNDFLKHNFRINIKLIYIKNSKHLGIPKSLNEIIKISKFPLIMRLDSDDVWTSNHSSDLVNFYKKNKNSLIIAEKKNINHFRKLFHDKYFIFDNPTIHSSWLINLNVNRSFRYICELPEDYSTLSNYLRKGYKICLISNKSTIYNDNPFGQSKVKFANRDINKIRKKNFTNYVNIFKKKDLDLKNIIEYFYINILNLINFFRK